MLTWEKGFKLNEVRFEQNSQLKQKLNETMQSIDKIDRKKWHLHRKLFNNYDFSSRKIAINRAFYKLWEIAKENPWLFQNCSKSLSIAEAPGSFIQTIYLLQPNCKIVATSRPPSSYRDVVVNSRVTPTFSKRVINIPNTEFIYLDMLNITMLSKFINKCREFDCITADGGIDENQEYDKKESLHFDLILSEIVTILLTLKLNGNCIVKFFELFDSVSINMIYLLTKHFHYFEIIKPRTSRPTNSEKYLLCRGFRGTSHSKMELLSLLDQPIEQGSFIRGLDIPAEFEETIFKLNYKFVENQISSIKEVVNMIDSAFDFERLIENKKQVFKNWVSFYELPRK